jgi:hypothetical protein
VRRCSRDVASGRIRQLAGLEALARRFLERLEIVRAAEIDDLFAAAERTGLGRACEGLGRRREEAGSPAMRGPAIRATPPLASRPGREATATCGRGGARLAVYSLAQIRLIQAAW